MARMNFLGMDMDQTTAARIVAAVRACYPDLTASQADRQAVMAVVKWWLKNCVADYEGRQAAGDLNAKLAQTQADHAAVYRSAVTAADTSVETDVVIPTTGPAAGPVLPPKPTVP